MGARGARLGRRVPDRLRALRQAARLVSGGRLSAAARPAESVVVAEGLSKSYRRWGRTRAFGTLKSALLGPGIGSALSPADHVPALTDVSFAVRRGDTFGVIGANGSGKSTLLKLVSGILKPTAGRLSVSGKVSALIELGAGFHPEISGRENVVINGVMLGLTRKAIERKLPEIIEFSGLADFIDEPVKTYSSGMYVRLGFAVAVHVDPEILVVDEVLAVGDEAFSRRCLDTIREFSARGKTIFFVTHALALVEELCNRVLYLEAGRVKGIGDPREMMALYRLDVAAGEGERLATEHVADQVRLRAEPSAPPPVVAAPAAPAAEATPADGSPDPLAGGPPAAPPEDASPEPERARRWGDRSAEITGVRLLGADGAERYSFRSGESIVVEIAARPSRPLTDFVFGIGIFTTEDFCVHGTNTETDGLLPRRFDAPAVVRVVLPRCELGEGTYLLDIAVHAKRGTPYDYWRGACRFQVTSPLRDVGVYRPDRSWSFEGGVAWK